MLLAQKLFSVIIKRYFSFFSENSKLKERMNWSNSSWSENGTSSEDFLDSEDQESIRSFHTINRGRFETLAHSYHIKHDHENVQVDFQTLDKDDKGQPYMPISYEHLYDNSAGRSLNSVNVKTPYVPVAPKQIEHADTYQPMNTVVVSTPSVHQVFHTCSDLQCESGGICVPDFALKRAVRCRCPLGRSGIFCEQGECQNFYFFSRIICRILHIG